MIGRWNKIRGGLIILLLSLCFAPPTWSEQEYRVKAGDTLSGISKSFGITTQRLKEANGLEKDTIKQNQVLLIPSSTGTSTVQTTKKAMGKGSKKPSQDGAGNLTRETEPYVVQQGDTLYLISKRAGFSQDEIKKMNGLRSSTIQAGQVLALPRAMREGEVEELEELGDPEELGGEKASEVGARTEEIPESLSRWSNTEERNLFVRVVRTFLGVPYRLGGATLKGIDCSAFCKKIYQIFSVDLPRTAREQIHFGKGVKREELVEGDLVFFRTRRPTGTHVGIYIGNNEFIHASSRRREVKVDNLDMPYFSTRFLKGVRVKELERDL